MGNSDIKALRLRRLLGRRLQDRIRTSNFRPLLLLRSRLGQSHVLGGRVTVIVPVYNVESYLRECLESIRVQNYPDLEVIIVDDGSPDASIDIAREFARSDRRFKIIRQPNAGLGAARNTGVRYATGDFITFVDSDDAVPYDAYKTMVTTLKRTGSDFVSGGIERWKGRRKWRDQWVARVHARDHFQMSLDDLPEFTKDVFVSNKLFRTDFFRRVVGLFPENTLYEDQEPSARALLQCSTFDILETTTYFWRMRVDGSSITQNKLSERDIEHRLAVARRVESIYREHGSKDVYSYWLQKTAGFDFIYYYRLSHRGTDAYWETLVEAAHFLMSKLSSDDWSRVPARERVLAYLISTGDREAVARTIGAQAQFGAGVPVLYSNTGFRIDMAKWGLEDLKLPDSIAELGVQDTELRSGINELYWSESGNLEVDGFIHIDKFPTSIAESDLVISAIAEDGRVQVLDSDRYKFDEDSPLLPGSSFASFPESGFHLSLPVATLLRELGNFTIQARLECGGVSREAPLVPQGVKTIPANVEWSEDDGGVILVSVNRRHGIRVALRRAEVSVTQFQISRGRTVSFSLRAIEPLGPSRVRAVNRSTAQVVSRSISELRVDEETRVELPLPRTNTDGKMPMESVWVIEMQSGDRSYRLPFPVGTPAEILNAEDGALSLRASKRGDLELSDLPWRAQIARVEPSEHGLTIIGKLDAAENSTPTFTLMRTDGMRFKQHSLRLSPSGSDFEVTMALNPEPRWGAPFISTTQGIYRLYLSQGECENLHDDAQLVYFENRRRSGHRYVVKTPSGFADVSDVGEPRSLVIVLQRPLRVQEKRQVVQLEGVEGRREYNRQEPILSRTVLCVSYSGASVHDSPAPIAEAMLRYGLVDEVIWGVSDLRLASQCSGRAVVIDSPEFVELLHRAKYLINNAHFPHYFRKRDDQVYIQTWHGTALKRIANDVPPTSLSDRYRDLMSREVNYWDVLLAQSPEAGTKLAQAFGYDGQVLDEGYPRNDFLADQRVVEESRRRFRERFGIGEDTRVLLYAPTWRDNVRAVSASAQFETLDPTRILDSLENTVILFRGHSNTAGFGRRGGDSRVLDVSGVSDLGSIFAASDMLICDYSSIFFDYFVTRKPIVGFAPDLEAYSTQLRGLYYSYSEAFPGPVAVDNAALIKLLQDPPTESNSDFHLLQEIRQVEDGRATQRVIEWLQEERG